MRRAWVAVLASVGALGVIAAIAVAQTSPPTVAVTATPTSVTLPATPVAAGPTTFTVTRQGTNKGLNVYVALLVPGVSLDQLQAALRRDDRTGGESALGLVSIQASLFVSADDTSRSVTFTLKPGLTYVVVSEPDTENGPPPSRGIGTFTTAATANGATAAAPGATVRMRGLRFRGDRVLPRNGVVRVTNEDGVPHFALAFPLRRGVTTAGLRRAVRSSSDRAFGRIVAGAPYGLQNLISGGDVVNDHEVSFPKAGRYALICFFSGHEQLGMYRIVTVR